MPGGVAPVECEGAEAPKAACCLRSATVEKRLSSSACVCDEAPMTLFVAESNLDNEGVSGALWLPLCSAGGRELTATNPA